MFQIIISVELAVLVEIPNSELAKTRTRPRPLIVGISRVVIVVETVVLVIVVVVIVIVIVVPIVAQIDVCVGRLATDRLVLDAVFFDGGWNSNAFSCSCLFALRNLLPRIKRENNE